MRKDLLSRRSRIPEDQYYSKSGEIIETLQRLPEVSGAQIIHCYISMNQRREVNTHSLLKELMKKGHTVAVPLTHMETGELTHVVLKDFNQLKSNRWGVLEPVQGERISEEELDLVIVPMVGGDALCNRIGYGKGFYDRFLQKVACPAIGLLFECCLVEEIPVEPFDVRLNKLITEKRIIG